MGRTGKPAGRRSLMLVCAAFAAGLLAFVAAAVSSAELTFGWFAYAPLSEGAMLSEVVMMSRTSAVLYVTGVLCLLAGAYVLGLRRGGRTDGR
ncbi:hypothetical protein EV380_0993 [Zhihengliuella halotolerans]|uniref:Uncharacterized protein n=2 Tax=Zhihengliuella halotolerans TaxID=370736 RepID=A0A4Q8ACT3_9MICC|nr:hypothetical protein EV380_0993 [Zhihengliuella halotolerans]